MKVDLEVIYGNLTCPNCGLYWEVGFTLDKIYQTWSIKYDYTFVLKDDFECSCGEKIEVEYDYEKQRNKRTKNAKCRGLDYNKHI